MRVEPLIVRDVEVATPEDTPVTFEVAVEIQASRTATFAIETPPAHGAITLAGARYTYTPAADYAGPDLVVVRVGDGRDSQTAMVRVTVAPINDAPVAGADSFAGGFDRPLIIEHAALLANDTDLEGAPLVVSGAVAGAHGSVAFEVDRITFTPESGFSGLATFAYTVSDGELSATGTATVSIGANTAPVAVDDAATTPEDVTLVLAATTLLANDLDLDLQTLAVTAVGNAMNCTVTRSGTTITVVPSAEFHGAATFDYTITDGATTDTARVTIAVVAVPDAPIAVADAVTTTEDLAGTVNVLANDTDPDGDPLAVTAVVQPAHGSVVMAGGVATYTPLANYAGADAFSYTVADGQGGTATAGVTVMVVAVDDAPVAANGAAGVTGATTLALAATDVDTIPANLTFSIVASPANGTLGAVAGNQVTYTGNAGYTGPESFTFRVFDGTQFSNTATVALTVTAALACGDGTRSGTEECDDSNTASGDGCEADCTWTCGTGPGPGPHAVAVDGFNASCYASYAVSVDFAGAVAFCEARGAHLATLVAQHEQDAVAAALGTLDRAWLGANDASSEAAFVWTTGESLGFTAWAGGQPDDASAGEDCLEIAAASSRLWNDRACTAASKVICEFDRFPTSPEITTLVYADITLGDIDGDGDVDFVGNHDFTTGHNDGLGTYTQRKVNSPLPPPPVPGDPSLTTPVNTLGDFDGDGDLDLARFSEVAVYISFNDGTGAYTGQVASPLPAGSHVVHPQVGDVTGDGKVDLVFGDSFNARFTVMRNTDAGTFAAGVDVATAHYATTLALLHFDDDLRLDVVVGEHTAATIAIFHNTSSATVPSFTLATRLPFDGIPRWLATDDFDEDGETDIVVAGDDATAIYYTDGLGGTNGASTHRSLGGGVVRVVTGDLDGDGHADFAVESQGARITSVFYGGGDGSVSEPSIVAHTRYGFFDLDCGDANGDGIDDLFVTAAGQPQTAVHRGAASRTFPNTLRLLVGYPGTPNAIESGRFSGAATAEFAIGTTLGVVVHLAGGTLFTAVPGGVQVLRKGDFNGDGALDLAVGTPGGVTLLLNAGAGALTVGGASAIGAVRDLAVADVLGDGALDVIAVTASGAVVLEGNGAGGLSSGTPFAVGGDPRGVVVADFTGDGLLDFVTTSSSTPTLGFVRRVGAGFAVPVTIAGGADVSTKIAAGDFDGDGILDLALGLPDRVALLHGTGGGTFPTLIDDHAGAPTRIVVADMDRDGQDDVIYTTGEALNIARHRPDGFFTDPFERHASNAIDVAVDELGRGLEAVTVEAALGGLGGIGVYEDGWN